MTGGLSAGLAVMVGILVTGHNSGAHMNPAVSLGMAVWGRIPLSALPAYMLAQFSGALAASGMVLAIWWDLVRCAQTFLVSRLTLLRRWVRWGRR